MKTTNLILPTVAFSANDFVQAEKLLDLLAAYKNRNKSGYILLVAAPDTHPEQHKRMQIAAEIGFEHVGLLTVGWPPADPKNPRPEKYEQVNRLFKEAAIHIAKHYKEPFVWLEPDSIPTGPGWLEHLSEAYHEQPKLYMSPVLAGSSGKCIGRVGVYPRGCAADIGKHFDGKVDFVVAAGQELVNKASKTKLIQHLPLERAEDIEKVRVDAVIVHGDKKGILLSAMLNDAIAGQLPKEPAVSSGRVYDSVEDMMKGEGFSQEIQDKVKEMEVKEKVEAAGATPPLSPPPTHIDKRSKAYRDAQKAALALA